MNAEKKGNFTVNCGSGGIELAGFLIRKPEGEIIVMPNAPTRLSKSDIATVINAVQKGANSITINGKLLNIEIIWQTDARDA